MTLRLITMKRLYIPLLFLMLLVAACQNTPNPSAPSSASASPSFPLPTVPPVALPTAGELDGNWVLVSGSFDGTDIPVSDRYDITLDIAGSRLGGVAGCNNYGGDFAIDGDKIEIGVVAMTEMACLDEQRMAAESAYLGALDQVGTFDLQGEQLTLSGDGVMLQFEMAPPVDAASLLGTNWILDTLIDGDTASSVSEMPATIIFADDNTFTGSTGCRDFSGEFTLEEGSATVSNLTNTDQACDTANEAQDEQVLSVIGSGFSIQVDGGRLTLINEDGLGLSFIAGA